MKSSFLILCLFSVSFISFSQSVTIEPGSIAAKMTTAQRLALSAPTDGTLVFDTNTQSYWYRSSGNWIEINGNGSGSPVVPEQLPKVTSKYQAISLPNETVTGSKMEISDLGTILIGYSTATQYTLVLKRNGGEERFTFNRGNSVNFGFVINDGDEILMVYDSTFSGDKRLKYRMFDGTNWSANGIASPAFTNVIEYTFCINDNGRAFIAWTQNDAVTTRVFLSSYDGTSWTHPSNYFDYFNPDWGNPSNFNPCSSIDIGISVSNNALITWRQNIIGVSHAFKAEFNGSSWTKPSSSSDYIDQPPTNYSLLGLKSSMNEQGEACILFTYSWFNTSTEFANYDLSYDYKSGSSWTTDVSFDTFGYQTTFDNAFFQTLLINTNSAGIFVYYTLRITSSGFVISNFRNLRRLTSSSATIENFVISTGNDSDLQEISVDVNTDLQQQYSILYPLVGPSEWQVFSLYSPYSSVNFGYADYNKYLNEDTESSLGSSISKLSENNRTRAVLWQQDSRLYLSAID